MSEDWQLCDSENRPSLKTLLFLQFLRWILEIFLRTHDWIVKTLWIVDYHPGSPLKRRFFDKISALSVMKKIGWWIQKSEPLLFTFECSCQIWKMWCKNWRWSNIILRNSVSSKKHYYQFPLPVWWYRLKTLETGRQEFKDTKFKVC